MRGCRASPVSRRAGGRAAALLVALLPPLLLAPAACTTGKPPPPVLRVGYSAHDHHAPLYVAAGDPEWFRRNGGLFLREVAPREEYELVRGEDVVAVVRVDASAGGEMLIRKLAENQYDLAFGGVPAMIHQIDRGAGIRIVAPVMTEGAGLVVRTDLPVSNWREFADHVRRSAVPVRIGYKIGRSVQNLIFEEGLRAEGIAYGTELDAPGAKLVLLNLQGQENLIPALKEGFIDGFVANQPQPAKAVHAGVGKFVASLADLPPEGQWQGSPCCALAVDEAYARRHAEAVAAFVALMRRAGEYLTARPDEARALVAGWLGLPEAVEGASLPTIRFTSAFDTSWNRGVETWVGTMLEAGELGGEVRRAFRDGTLERRLYLQDVPGAAGAGR